MCEHIGIWVLFFQGEGRGVEQELTLKFLGGISTAKKQGVTVAVCLLAQFKCNGII